MTDVAPPPSSIDALIPGGLPPVDLDPLAAGILMEHQVAWIEDKSDLKLAEKGRRTGFTFAEALDDALTAATQRAAGGDNIWYIGDTRDKGREFVAVCAQFAQRVAAELVTVEEFLFEDKQEDGTSRMIAAYRIRFASGFQVCALSSRPANIRGLQGIVVIDEAAFHPNVRGVIDACNALLIWGGKIRIISTHNGALNPFAELIREIRAGKWTYKIHRATFDDAVANGLYERVCLIRGWTPSPEGKAAWYKRVRSSYGTRLDAMREELDAIPREGGGVLLPLAWIEAASRQDYVVKRWAPPADRDGRAFVDWPEAERQAEMQAWLDREVAPLLPAFRDRLVSVGGDFAMRQDRSSYAFGYVAAKLSREVPLIVEMRQCPYGQQKQALFWICDRIRLGAMVLDANGNGMVMAQEARQKFGPERVLELIANDAWYREYTPRFRSGFEDRLMGIPADIDVRDDLRQIQEVRGVGKVPSAVRTEGTDGGRRHGDAAVALMNFHAATQQPTVEIAYQGVRRGDKLPEAGGDEDDGPFARPSGGGRFGGGAW